MRGPKAGWPFLALLSGPFWAFLGVSGRFWQELAAKNRVESKYTGNQRWFSPIELRTAQAIVSEAARIAKLRESKSTEQTTGEYDPASFEG